jgi:hypothetical protein
MVMVNEIIIASSGLFTALVSVPSCLLGLIHGDIGIFQEDTFICSIIGIDGDADTRRHNELMGVNKKGLTKTVNNLLYNLDRIFYYFQVRKDQHKLITTEARNGITLPQRCS